MTRFRTAPDPDNAVAVCLDESCTAGSTNPLFGYNWIKLLQQCCVTMTGWYNDILLITMLFLFYYSHSIYTCIIYEPAELGGKPIWARATIWGLISPIHDPVTLSWWPWPREGRSRPMEQGHSMAVLGMRSSQLSIYCGLLLFRHTYTWQRMNEWMTDWLTDWLNEWMVF